MSRPVEALGCGLAILLAVAPLGTPRGQDSASDILEISDAEGFSAGESPTAPAESLADIEAKRDGLIRIPILTPARESAQRERDALRDGIGLRLGAAYTALVQHGEPTLDDGADTGAGGDLDLLAAWTLLGRDTPDFGQAVVDGEYRHAIGSLPPSALGAELGTLQRPAGGFNDRGWVLRNLYYQQRFWNGRIRLLMGRADPSDFAGGHAMQSVNNSFTNRAFSAATTVPFPGHGASLGVSFRPTELGYLTAGATNAYAETTINDLPLLDEGDLFSFVETGYTPAIGWMGDGRYRVLLWHMDARPLSDRGSDRGYSLIIDQELGRHLQVFARFGDSDSGVTGIRRSTEVGLGYRDFMGVRGNLAGLAVASSQPTAGGDPETLIEGFVRLQLTASLQATLNLQGVFDPVNNPEDLVTLIGGRIRLTF